MIQYYMVWYIKEHCLLDDGIELDNILEFNLEEDTWKFIVCSYHIVYNTEEIKDDLLNKLQDYMAYVRFQDNKFGYSRFYDILTEDELKKELFINEI